MRKTIDRDRERAVTLICKSIVSADIMTVRRMLCLTVGHPAAVRKQSGTFVCARCLVPTHASVGLGEGWVEDGIGHWTLGKLTPTDLLLTGIPEVAKVPV